MFFNNGCSVVLFSLPPNSLLPPFQLTHPRQVGLLQQLLVPTQHHQPPQLARLLLQI